MVAAWCCPPHPGKFMFYQLLWLCHWGAEGPARISASSQEPKWREADHP